MQQFFESNILSKMSNEDIALAINELNEEKKRREKKKKYEVALNLRNALREFLDCEAECDFSMVVGISGSELLGIEVECDCDWGTEDLNYVEIDPFDTEILKNICEELSRCLDKDEG